MDVARLAFVMGEGQVIVTANEQRTIGKKRQDGAVGDDASMAEDDG